MLDLIFSHLRRKLIDPVREASQGTYDPGQHRYNRMATGFEEAVDGVHEAVGNEAKSWFGFGPNGSFTRRRARRRMARQERFETASESWAGMSPANGARARAQYAQSEANEWLTNTGTGRFANRAVGMALSGAERVGRGAAGALRMAGGVQGVGVAAAGVATSILHLGGSLAMGTESVARTLLTGGVWSGGAKTALDAYLPGFRKYASSDMRKYALNPRIGRRLVGAAAAVSLGAGFSEALGPRAAPASFYMSAGGDMRHRNDMGSGAAYGQALMGQQSVLNKFAQADTSTKIRMLDMVI